MYSMCASSYGKYPDGNPDPSKNIFLHTCTHTNIPLTEPDREKMRLLRSILIIMGYTILSRKFNESMGTYFEK